jgi:hypothetical protein
MPTENSTQALLVPAIRVMNERIIAEQVEENTISNEEMLQNVCPPKKAMIRASYYVHGFYRWGVSELPIPHFENLIMIVFYCLE